MSPVAVECRISNPNDIPSYDDLASTRKCISCPSTTAKERPHEILKHITLPTTSSLRDEEDILGDLLQYLRSATTNHDLNHETNLQNLFLS